MRRRGLRRAILSTTVLATVAAAAVLVPLGSARLANTWAGSWSTNIGWIKLDAGGSGTYEFCDGKISGSVSGNGLKGTWTQKFPCGGASEASGPFEFTMAADGGSWKGRWHYARCGEWRTDWNGSACTDGPCLQNGAGGGKCGSRRASAARASNEVRVIKVTPSVEVHKSSFKQGCFEPVTLDMVLKQGDEISCDPDGSVTLAFADNSTVTVRNTTQLKIASFFTENGLVRTEILLKMGEAAAEVNKSEATKSDFRIKTPTDVNSVRGTIFSVLYDPIAKVGVTSVTRGSVEVDPVAGGLATQTVPAGKEVAVMASSESKVVVIGKAGTPPGAISREAARKLVLAQVARADEKCNVKVLAFGLKPASKGWLVTIKLSGGRKGWGTWRVTGRKAVASNKLAKDIAAGCGEL